MDDLKGKGFGDYFILILDRIYPLWGLEGKRFPKKIEGKVKFGVLKARDILFPHKNGDIVRDLLDAHDVVEMAVGQQDAFDFAMASPHQIHDLIKP